MEDLIFLKRLRQIVFPIVFFIGVTGTIMTFEWEFIIMLIISIIFNWSLEKLINELSEES